MKKGSLKKKFAAVAAASVLVLGGAEIIGSHIPVPAGQGGHSFIQNLDNFGSFAQDGLHGVVDIRAYLPQDILPLLQDKQSDQDLLTVVEQLQASTAAAQRTGGASLQEQRDLATVAKSLEALKIVVEGQGKISFSDISTVQDFAHGTGEFSAAVQRLANDARTGNPAMLAFATTFLANDSAVAAGQRLALVEAPAQTHKILKSAGASTKQELQLTLLLPLLQDSAARRSLLTVVGGQTVRAVAPKPKAG